MTPRNFLGSKRDVTLWSACRLVRRMYTTNKMASQGAVNSSKSATGAESGKESTTIKSNFCLACSINSVHFGPSRIWGSALLGKSHVGTIERVGNSVACRTDSNDLRPCKKSPTPGKFLKLKTGVAFPRRKSPPTKKIR